MTGHRIEWDHSDCQHAEDDCGCELDEWCSPSGRVYCVTPIPEPLVGSCRVVCAGTGSECEDGYEACEGEPRCSAELRDREFLGCYCEIGCGPVVRHSESCPTVTHPFEGHPAEPHCTRGHLLQAVECQACLFLNEDPSLLREDAEGEYTDGPISVGWTGGAYEWRYVA